MIAQLALQKNFNALSPAECAQVLAEMSQEEYDQLHKLLLATRQMDSILEPPAQLRAKLLLRMAQQPKPDRLRRLMTARLPLWQSSAALILGIAVVSMMQKDVVVEKNIIAWQLRVDTVYQEKILWRDRIVKKNKVVFRKKMPPQTILSNPKKIDNQALVPDFQARELSESHIGTSLGDTPELMDFFMQGDR